MNCTCGMQDAPVQHFAGPGVHHETKELKQPEHYYEEIQATEVDRLIYGGMCCKKCGRTRAAHPKRPKLEEKREALRASLLGLKSMLEEIEEKTRVCYLEVVELVAEMDQEGR